VGARWLFLDSHGAKHLPPLLEGLRDRGHSVVYAGGSSALRERLAAESIPTVGLKIRAKLDPCAWRNVRKMFARLKPDAVVTIGSRDAYVGVWARGISKRGRALGPALFARRGAYAALSPLDPVERRVYGAGGVDRIVTVSHALAAHFEGHGVDRSRLRTIYTAVAAPGPDARGVLDLRNPLGIPRDRFLLGMLANYRRVKGAETLLDAMARLRSEGANVHLAIAGAGYRGSLRRRADRLGIADRISWVGPVASADEFTPAVDCLVVPSRGDGLPVSAIEATLCETPVVGTRVGGIPEILDGERGGWLAAPRDDVALADKVREVMDAPEERRRRAHTALGRNRELFGVDRCTDGYERLLEGG